MKRTGGFTLVELLVSIMVAGVLIALAIPAFNNFVMNDRDTGQINSLVASFNYARSEAVKRNTTVGVEVCPSSDKATCNAPATGWAAGWIVLDLDPTDLAPVLQAVPTLGGSNALTSTAATLTYKSNGGVVAANKVKICDTRGSAYARDVEVSTVGTITTSQKAGFDASGVALTCP